MTVSQLEVDKQQLNSIGSASTVVSGSVNSK
jgi:hypothetical protein